MNRGTGWITALALALTVAACGSDDGPVDQPTADDAWSATETTTSPSPTATQTGSRQAVPAGVGGTPRGTDLDPADVDTSDADAVTDAVLTLMYAHDTEIDLSPADAARRAAQLLTPEYAATVNQTIPGGGGADWINLAEANGYTTVELENVTEYDAPEDTDTDAYRERIVTVTSHTPLTELPDPAQYLTWITLTRPTPDDPWAVASVDIDIL